MGEFARGFTALGLVLSSSGALATGQRIELVHPEREHLSGSARRQAVLNDLDTLLVGPATPNSIATAPRAVDSGLCQRNVITLEYRHAGDGNSRNPFKPFAISGVSTEYHSIGYSNELSASETQKACRSLDGTKAYWAYSDNEYTARFGLIALKEVATAIRANRAVSLDCKPLQDTSIEERCGSEFLAAAEYPFSVSDCRESPSDGLRDCFVYGLDAYRVTIIRVWPANGGGAVTTVKLEPQDIVA